MIYNCIYCGREIKSDCIFEGRVNDFMKFMQEKTRGLSDNCECRKEIAQEVEYEKE